MFAIVYLFLEKYVYWCELYSEDKRATLKRANYSSEGCSANFSAQVVHTFDKNMHCDDLVVGAETIYFISNVGRGLVTFDMEGF